MPSTAATRRALERRPDVQADSLPGKIEAMCASSPRPSSITIERGSPLPKPDTTSSDALVVGGGLARVGQFAAYPMHVVGRNRHVVDQRGLGHAVVAVRMIRRHVTLVAPEQMHVLATGCGRATAGWDPRGSRRACAGSSRRRGRRTRCRASATAWSMSCVTRSAASAASWTSSLATVSCAIADRRARAARPLRRVPCSRRG